MKNSKTYFLVALTCLLLPLWEGAHSEEGPQLSLEGNMGLRSGRFHGAPKANEIWLSEASVGGYSGALVSVGAFDFMAGANLGMSRMRGDLGPGLLRFAGYRAGAVLRTETLLASITSNQKLKAFLNLGYTYGQFKGNGSDSWDIEPASSLFLMGRDVVEVKEKSYRTYGPQIGLGLRYAINEAFYVSSELDVHLETLSGSHEIVSQGRQISGKEQTDFTTRSMLIGAGTSL